MRSCWLWGGLLSPFKVTKQHWHDTITYKAVMSTDNSYLASSSPTSDTSRTGSYGGSITPKALTTYITSQISRAVRSVDWSNDTESGASAIKALIGMAGLVKERLQTEESGPDSGSSDGGESKNAAGEITIKVSRCKEARHTV